MNIVYWVMGNWYCIMGIVYKLLGNGMDNGNRYWIISIC